MIRTLGLNTEWYEETSVEAILEYFADKDQVQYDCETMGFDPYTTPMMCFQLGDYKNQYVISPEYIQHFKELLEEKLIIGHNIKFDLRFLYLVDIFPTKVYDTFLAEGVLYCGLTLHRKGLDAVALNRLGVTLDKSIRKGIGKHDLTKEEIQYSADDVKYLEQIKDSQEKELTEKDLHVALKIENNFVLCLAYIEFSGFRLDIPAWKAKMERDQEKAKASRKILDDFIMENNFTEFISIQGDLFEGTRKVTLNWDSPKQVITLFKKLKIPTRIVEKGVEKDSVESKAISKYGDQFPIVKSYLKYKEDAKVVGTYGQSFLDQINPVTGKIHTNFKQILDTGRISSGGKNKATGEEYINFQNIPANPETRGCFIASEGNILIDADYSGQEQVILANKSLDPNLLKFYDEGFSDMHSFTAYNMFAEIREAVGELVLSAFERIKKEFKKLRNSAKSAGFAINYGGNATTIATNENISQEDANNIYEKYFEAFPGLTPYFNRVKMEGFQLGYILIDNDVTRRKSFIPNYEKYLELKKEMNNDFWDKWKQLKQEQNNPLYTVYKEKISLFFKVKGGIERRSLNYPIQGTAANITKISAILFFKWLREQNLLKKVWFCNQVHDENVLDCPKDIAEMVARKLEECMIEAGKPFCKRVPLKADAVTTPIWEH